MYSIISKNKSKADFSVTGTYISIIKDACIATGDFVETVEEGHSPKSRDSFIVTDTLQSAFSYLLKGYPNHIIWMQGVVPEESYMRHHSKFRFFFISQLEKIVLKRAKLVILVSEEMQQHYERKYSIKLRQKSIIMPCYNDTIPLESSFYDDKYKQNNFVYVGSLHAWQCFEQTVQLYKEIELSSSTPTKLYVFTFHQEAAIQILHKYHVHNYTVECVDKDAVSERIKNMKYGFVLREDCTVNNVATPTKLSNYLACGIIPIYSSVLKSFTEFDKKQGIGIVYDLHKPEEGKRKILEHMNRQVDAQELYTKCKEAFDTYYNAELYRREITEKLSKLKSK